MPAIARDSQRLHNVGAITLVVLAVFLMMCLLSHDSHDPPNADYPPNYPLHNLGGLTGSYISWLLLNYLGIASYIIILYICFWAYLLSRGNAPGKGWFKLAAALTTVLVISALLGLAGEGIFSTARLPCAGGFMGAYSSAILVRLFAVPGTFLLLLTVGTAATLFSSDMLLYDAAAATWRGLRTKLPWGRIKTRLSPVLRKPFQPGISSTHLRQEKPAREEPAKFTMTATAERPEKPVPPAFPNPGTLTPSLTQDYQLPSVDLLDEIEEVDSSRHEQVVQEKARVLEHCLEQFGVGAKVVAIDSGPVITQYELELAPGIKVGKVMALHDDIAMALKAPSVRIVAPIPGRGTVGVEVPNIDKDIVQLREMFDAAGSYANRYKLPLFLGKDASGHPLVADLTELPHLLIAGCTGSGKSVCINTVILSLLMTRTPEQARLLLVDPKIVEFAAFRSLPHLLCPVVTDMQKAVGVLAWAEEKMDERYDLLARAGVRSIAGYNSRSKATLKKSAAQSDPEEPALPEKLPYIIIVIDELADLMLQAGRGEVETSITRLAQKSRAVGLHIVFATQRPSVDVITGLIKSNLPARLSFQVASKVDSRTILDRNGAEKLLGKGDMLYLCPRTGKLIRAQATFTGDSEIHRVVSFVSAQSRAEFAKDLMRRRPPETAGRKRESGGHGDKLYEQAVRIVLESQRGSVSLLQRRMEIGYGRAARLIDMMAEDGIVGDYKGSQAREVVLTLEEWQADRQ